MLLILLLIHYPGVKEHITWYATYTSNILLYEGNATLYLPHTWSLSVEEQFYLLWPWVILFTKEKYLRYVFLSANIICVISCFLTTYHNGYHPPILVFNCMFCLGLGGFYAFVKADKIYKQRFQRWLLPFFILCLFTYLHWKYSQDQFWAHTSFLYRVVYGVIAMQLILLVINNRSGFIRKYILENSIFNYIGRISYGLYVYHFPIHFLYEKFIEFFIKEYPNLNITNNIFYLSYFMKLLILFLISELSYRFFEKPLLKLKNRFAYNTI